MGNDSGKHVNAWKEFLKEYDKIIIETKVVSSRANEADYYLIHRIYETAEREHKKNKRFCMVIASADQKILEASRYVADVLVQFARSNQMGHNKIADFVVFSNRQEVALIEELAKKISSSFEQTPSGDFLICYHRVVQTLKNVGVISKERKHPLKWILKRYDTIFSWDKEHQILTIKKNAPIKTIKKLLEHFENHI